MAKKIEVALTLDSKQFDRSIAQSEAKVDKFSKSSSAGIGKVGAALAALGGGAAIKGIIDTGAAFQDLQNSLNVVFGGIEEGADAFDRVQGFAASTQFSVQTLTQAFVQLKGAGVEPTEELLQTFADTASVTTDQMGTFQAALDLVSRSTAGGLGLEDLNRLADRGIPVFNILKDRLGLTRLEVSEFGKTAEGANTIVRELLAGLQEDFGGALESQVGLLNFELNQLGDAFDKLKVALFGTFDDQAAQAVQSLTAAINKLSENIEPLVQIAKGLAQIAAVATFIFPLARGLKAASTALFALKGSGSLLAASGPRLATFFKNTGSNIKKGLTEPITTARKALSRFFQRNGKFVKKLDKDTGKFKKIWEGDILSPLGRTKLIAQKIAEGFFWIGGTVLGIQGLKNTIEGANEVAENFAQIVGPPRELFEQNQLKKLEEEYNKLTDNDTLFDELPKSVIVSTSVLKDFLDALDKVIPSATTFEDELKKLNEVFGDPKTVKEIKDYESALNALRDAFGVNEEFDKFRDSFEDVESIEEYNDKLTTLQGLLNSGKISAREFADAKEELDERLGENQSLLDFIATLNTATDTLANDLATSLMEGKNVLDDFKNFFKTLVQQLIADAIKMLFIIPILQAVGFSVGPTGSIAGLSGSGLLGKLGFKQTGIGGGNLMPNRPVLVGESGPEVFYPASSGSLQANGMATQVTYNINAVDAPSFQQLVAQDPEFIYSVTRAGARRLPGVA